MPHLFARLWKKALPPDREKEEAPEKKEAHGSEPASPYTDEEARKVKERLQGLGYID